MSIQSECTVCTMRQAQDVCDFVGADESNRQSLLKRVMQILIQGIESSSEESVGFHVHEELKRITNSKDPYKAAKEQSIQSALRLFPGLMDLVSRSDNPLGTAVQLSIAGNVIDFGPSSVHNTEAAIDEVLKANMTHFDFGALEEEINKSRTVLILGDNAGETVFDRVLISRLNREVFYAVKSQPILNDAIREDAVDSGLDVVATIVENGSPRSGTYLPWCSQQFIDLYHSADMVISKGHLISNQPQ